MASIKSSSKIDVHDDDEINEKENLANSPAVIHANSEPIKHAALLRAFSGIDVNPETKENYMMVRSITMDEDGNLQTDAFLKEIFEGFITFSTGFVAEIFGHPSTIVLEENASITIASQIYERDYSNDKTSYEGVSTIEEYFKRRKELLESENKKAKITWLGAPSVVFSYKNRNELKQYLNNNPVINLFFWITSFNSSKCIVNYSVNAKKNKIQYCDKYEKIKQFCKNRNEYQIHKTYYDIMNPNEDTVEKYITSFEKIIEILLKEEKAVKEYNEVYDKTDFQRYNELFTYFFPWDIDGIERGGISNEKFEDLLKKINDYREKTKEDLIQIKEDTNLIHNMNILIKTLKQQHSKRTKNLSNNNYNYTYFLLAKYITLGECDVVKDDNKKSDILNTSDKDRILLLIDAIIEIMNNKLNIYEYQLENTNNFTMKSTTNEDTYDRSTPFVLFEQEQDSNNHTNVFISDLQLSRDKKGGKKKQKKQRCKMSRKKTGNKYRSKKKTRKTNKNK
jgi:hypothetical protein